MDISKLTHGAKMVLGGTILFLIVSIFHWQEVDLGIVSVGVNMWHGWGVLAGLVAIAIIVWEGLRLANMKIEIGLTPAMVTAALAILLLVFTVLKFLVSNEYRTFWAWLGLLLAILDRRRRLGEHEAARRVRVRDGCLDEDRGEQRRCCGQGRDRQGRRRSGRGSCSRSRRCRQLRLRPPRPRPRPLLSRRRPPQRLRPRPPRSRPRLPTTRRRRRRRLPEPLRDCLLPPCGSRHPATLNRMSENGLRGETGTMRVKSGLAEMLKGGVIMDVVNAEQAVIAENAGACAVMALERVPADIRRDGGVARMSDPGMIREIQEAVSIPVMAKCRIGHFAEAQILQALEIDYIDESEVLTPADIEHHVDKWGFKIPFVCGATNLGEALRRINEGAAMIRTKGEAGTGDVVNAVTHMRAVFGGIRRLQSLRSDELYTEAKNLQAPYELVRWVAENGRLPVVTFTAGGIATPADASLCMQLGADGVFVGSGIFKSGDPDLRAKAIVEATTHFQDAKILAEVSTGLGEPMVGISSASLADSERLEVRGW